MAGTSLLALIDDIASVLDDVALMTKIAAKKTAGMLGDDLALNAEQVAGVRADRELPVVWAVAKGSFRNKLILVPAALLISSVAPWVITPLLMVGGTYLCFEGFEKLVHAVERRRNGGGAAKHASDREHAFVTGSEDLRAYEHKKIRGAIRTDFILSAEIVVIALGTVRDSSFPTQVLVISGIAILMTVGVYGVVAAIVKLDDLGLYLVRTAGPRVAPGGRDLETSAVAAGSAAGRLRSRMKRFCGQRLVATAPLLMKLLAIVGTLAMFTVGGGILLHGLPGAESAVHRLEAAVARAPTVGPFVSPAVPTLLGALVGVVAGALALGVVKLAAWGWGFVSGADRDSDSDSDSSQTTRPKT